MLHTKKWMLKVRQDLIHCKDTHNITALAKLAAAVVACDCVPQEQQHDRGGKITFQEDDTFWVPADDVNELYRQLYSKKYREIVKQQVE